MTEAQWPVAAAGAAAVDAAKDAAKDHELDFASTTAKGEGEETEVEETSAGLKEGRMIGGWKGRRVLTGKGGNTRRTTPALAPIPIVNLGKVNQVKFEKRG